jgi:hypothetical protein
MLQAVKSAANVISMALGYQPRTSRPLKRIEDTVAG